MIFNCLGCGKSVSSRMDICPYCKFVQTEIVAALEEMQSHKSLSVGENYKGTIFSALWKQVQSGAKLAYRR
ncbi:MAG: hypothetical protein UR28_C0001G0055 [Candidatus Peregrinibacteria bacterium GW2011_GWF2_33_10]|nr:MAG: hypothetical protein UR28_C0001G0055 [Candidatus Peregrinibacteria bacterium GW2011_GWF2_33_10]OGJ44801.1 MAG: hypothetical protein A2263_06210 [Candidatus Peregrinibacteria bacterium RIFOXYA2_FULL_33_21]OGJ47384.1 MAG: hypothetical protein A2272_02610 [Candidatus Peregrinibacteria bacterium RIFOXYA12_FULL_33_12]OGJ50487.1 MAG: hypothetical protein A2307_02835 [Candidatus Peregrinibacteria bacterium RIFOXYB2_FULL_33_20]